jgi:hypothetical protein
MDTDIIFNSIIAEYIFFSRFHDIVNKIDHFLGNKPHFNKFEGSKSYKVTM